MNPENPNIRHFPALDGLRGLAILLVLAYHNFGFISFFSFGWLGVDLFFVLSGFLITSILLSSVGLPGYLRNFYMRRVLRIFPIYYLSLIVFLILLPSLSSYKSQLGYYTENQAWLWTYLQNWLYIFKPTNETSILHHFWSLALEEQFYLCWPLIILLIRKPRSLIILLAFILVSAITIRIILWVSQIKGLSYYDLYTFSRIDAICIGSMLALAYSTGTRFLKKYIVAIALGVIAVNLLFYFLNRYNHTPFPYLAIAGYPSIAIFFALVVYASINKKNKITNFLFNNAFMRFFGKISYGLYVYHWPIYILTSAMIAEWISKHAAFLPAQISASFIAVILTVVASFISYRYFEAYFIRLKKKFK